MAEIISLAYPTTSSLKDPATIQSMKLRVLKIIILAAAVSSGSALLLLSRKTPDTSSIPDVTPTSTPAVVAAENEAPPEKMPVEQPAFPVKKTVLNNKQPEEKPDPQKMPGKPTQKQPAAILGNGDRTIQPTKGKTGL